MERQKEPSVFNFVMLIILLLLPLYFGYPFQIPVLVGYYGGTVRWKVLIGGKIKKNGGV
jgi:hypothetical protein